MGTPTHLLPPRAKKDVKQAWRMSTAVVLLELRIGGQASAACSLRSLFVMNGKCQAERAAFQKARRTLFAMQLEPRPESGSVEYASRVLACSKKESPDFLKHLLILAS